MDIENVVYKDKKYYCHKKDEILPFAIIWTGLEIIMLRKISQAQKDRHHTSFHSSVESKAVDFVMGTRSWEEQDERGMGKG
jgi:hypothetical protein